MQGQINGFVVGEVHAVVKGDVNAVVSMGKITQASQEDLEEIPILDETTEGGDSNEE